MKNTHSYYIIKHSKHKEAYMKMKSRRLLLLLLRHSSIFQGKRQKNKKILIKAREKFISNEEVKSSKILQISEGILYLVD